MNTFTQAVGNMTTTTNGMPAYGSTNDPLVSLFFNIGSARNSETIVEEFLSALLVERHLAMKCLFWARDVRGGAGERETFRKILRKLETVAPELCAKNLDLIAHYGRADDLLEFRTPTLRAKALLYFGRKVAEGDALFSKWAPREKSARKKDALDLMAAMELTPKQYRKVLALSTKVVETQMCAKDWNNINYGHVPSVAAARYQEAFGRNDPTGYGKYKEDLKTGEAKINASAIFPHDVIRGGANGDWDVAEAQWKALPNYMDGKRVLPISDVSGSMGCKASGSLTCMDISIALGIYCSDKNTGDFKDMIITFDDTPQMVKVTGSLKERVETTAQLPWGGSTNFEATFDLILNHAVNNNVPKSDMPEVLVCLSDMQFNEAVGYGCSGLTAVKMAKKKFADAGYEAPLLVFWNLNAEYGSFPSTSEEEGVVMVSGFSPAVMKSVLKCDFNKITPRAMMEEVLMSSRYEAVRI